MGSVGFNWLVSLFDWGCFFTLLLLGHIFFLLRFLSFFAGFGAGRWAAGSGLVLLLVSLTITFALGALVLLLLAGSLVLTLSLSEWLEHLLLVEHVWAHGVEAIVATLEAHWYWLQVLVWVEATEASGESSQVSQIGDLDH